MQKKLLITLGLCLCLFELNSEQEEDGWGFFGDASQYFAERKDNGSNASFARWGAVVLASSGNESAEHAGMLLARVPELRALLANPAFSKKAKAFIGLMLMGQELPVTEGATDLQKGAGRLFAQMQQRSMFIPDKRGTLRFDVDQFSALRRDPDFQATTNALLYAIGGELGVGMLGGGNGMGFVKDLLLPLVIFRSRYGHFLPGTMRFTLENSFRYGAKRALAFMTGGDEKSAKELLTLCADTLSLVGLVSTEQVKHMADKDVKVGKLFDEWISRIRGKVSKDSQKLMSGAKDCFVSMGDAAYPRSFYNNGLRGAMDIMEISAPSNDPMDNLFRMLTPMRGPDEVYLGQPGTPMYQKQLEGFASDLRGEIATLEGEREKNRALLRKRSPLLGKLIG